jgi:hypothetical protein
MKVGDFGVERLHAWGVHAFTVTPVMASTV